ncbi:unnamed protein product [Dicrocoelium dendriticum]|nr:unnamed protein product [Dicrocoelium dendriticum]
MKILISQKCIIIGTQKLAAGRYPTFSENRYGFTVNFILAKSFSVHSARQPHGYFVWVGGGGGWGGGGGGGGERGGGGGRLVCWGGGGGGGLFGFL